MPSRRLPVAVNTLLPPRSVLPKKSGLYPKSPSKPKTPAPIHAKLAPQLKRLASTESPNSAPLSPPKLTPMNGMMRPSALAVPAKETESRAAMTSVRQLRADRQLKVMPDTVHALCRGSFRALQQCGVLPHASAHPDRPCLASRNVVTSTAAPPLAA